MNWNTKLFFHINQLIGRNHFLDVFGRAGAEWGIFAMLGWFGAASFIHMVPTNRPSWWPILFFAAFWSAGLLVSNILGLVVQEPRPKVTFPEINTLFRPMESWKSFPSDHAMTAFLLLFSAILFHLPFAWALLPLALWVAWGRVYAGVHYPIDVLGGLLLAAVIVGAEQYVVISLLQFAI